MYLAGLNDVNTIEEYVEFLLTLDFHWEDPCFFNYKEYNFFY